MLSTTIKLKVGPLQVPLLQPHHLQLKVCAISMSPGRGDTARCWSKLGPGLSKAVKITNTSDVMLCSYCGEHLTCDSERVPCPYDPGTGCAITIPCCYKPPPGQVTPAQPAVWTSTSRCVTPGLLTSSLATLCMGSTWDLSPPGGVD